MDFEAWTTQGHDPARRKRLALGYAVGTFGAAGLGLAIAATAGQVVVEEEEPLTVALAQIPEEQTEPEPEPEPEPEAPKPVAARPGRRMQSLKPPREVPQEKPAETEPAATSQSASDPYANSGTPGGTGSGVGSSGGAAPSAEPKPAPPLAPPKPKKAKLVRVTEDMTPPRCAIGTPGYPSSARASGVEGTVIVRYIVTASGSIAAVKALRGPDSLRGVAVAAVRAARCTPAKLPDGSAVATPRIAQFPFRLKT